MMRLNTPVHTTIPHAKDTIVNIQILRFFAAFWVLIYHAQYLINPQADILVPPWFFRLIQNAGFVGVDIFFVISGVIMALTTHDLANNVRNSARFISVRFTRIYTGWWPLFILYWLAAALGNQLEGKLFFASLFLFPTFLSNYILGLLWTLSFELYFYCMVAILILTPSVWRSRFFIIAFIGIAGFTTWSTALGYYTPTPPSNIWPLHGFVLHPLIAEFIGGFLLYGWIRKNKFKRVTPWAISATVFFVAAMSYEMKIAAPQGLHLEGFYGAPVRMLLIGGFALSLVAAAMIAKPWTGRLGNTLSQLGDASYSIYLSHSLVLALMMYCLPIIGWPARWHAPTLFILAISVLVFSVIYYKRIELPLYRWTRKHIDRWFNTPI
jgi:peptidoglycan/LPS O-acetylase OafA/YrhL